MRDAPPSMPGPTAVNHTATDEALEVRLDRLEHEKLVLDGELTRAREQLQLVFGVTTCGANSQDPNRIQDLLWQHYGALLRAGAMYVDRTGCCQRIELQHSAGRRIDLGTNDLRSALAAHVEVVRRTRGARLIVPTAAESTALRGASVLLGCLPTTQLETGVLIALRAGDDPPFEAHDAHAAEAVLGYGAQILNNVLTLRHLQRTAIETVCALVNAIDAKDNYTSDHSERVGGLARLAGEALGLPKDRLQVLEWAGLLHDVGKIGISEQILNKPGMLTPPEVREMKKHPRIGYEMLKPVAQFEPVLDAVLYHHENHDGSGYPEGRGGREIPLDAQIIHVVDVFDALTTHRPYRRAHDFERTIGLLDEGAGRVTDPQVTRLFVDALRRYMAEEPTAFRTRFAHLTEQPPDLPSRHEDRPGGLAYQDAGNTPPEGS